MTERARYWLAISMIPNIGPTLGTYLYTNNFEPEEFWRSSKGQLKSTYNSSEKLSTKIIDARKKIDLESKADDLSKRKIRWTTVDSPDFPESLKNIPGAPATIYYKGSLGVLDRQRAAIVGSRRPSAYGIQVTEHISKAVSSAGITVVSGLALGIDAIAHKTALQHGTTIAVLGCGIDIAYPVRNRLIYEKIVEHGCVISEYPPGTDPMPFRFPARNRIISGLSQLVIVTEANYKSGALLTADYALEQGKDVMAVPGNIYSQLSKGPHKLLKNGATPVEHPDDIFDLMGISSKAIHNNQKNEQITLLNDNEALLLNSVPFFPIHIDDIIVKHKMPADEISALLSILEIKGFVIQDIGKLYQRKK